MPQHWKPKINKITSRRPQAGDRVLGCITRSDGGEARLGLDGRRAAGGGFGVGSAWFGAARIGLARPGSAPFPGAHNF